MTALAQDRPVDQVAMGAVRSVQVGVAAGEILYEGAMVAPEADGYCIAAGSGTSGNVAGVAEANADNSAAGASDGDKSCNLLQGLFWRANHGTHTVTLASLFKVVYASDDQTISNDSTDGPVAGICFGIDSTLGVLVYIAGSVSDVASLEGELASVAASQGASKIGLQDAGTFTAAATVEAALAEIYQGLLSAQATYPIPMGAAWYEVDGTALAAFADGASTTPGLALDNSEAAGIRWNNNANPDPICTSLPLPQDLDESADVVVHVLASKSGATLADAVTFDVGAFFQTVGALHDADADAGGTSGAMTGDATAKTVQEVTLTIANADVPASPSVLTLTMQPTDGLLDTDDVTVHGVHLEYTKKLLTS